jgi:hypothetical protein
MLQSPNHTCEIENYISDKEFVSRIYKDLIKLNNKKTVQLKNGQRFE